MSTRMKTVLVAIIGLCVVFVCSIGCGSVVMNEVDAGADAGSVGAGGADAGSDALTAHPDKFDMSGAAGAAGASGVGGVGRPLGAGCAEDTQCGSGVCVDTGNTKMCCDSRPSECSVCTGGYVVPKQDKTPCGAMMMLCDATMTESRFPNAGSHTTRATNVWCRAGNCVVEVTDCTSKQCAPPPMCDSELYVECVTGTGDPNFPGAECVCVEKNGSICPVPAVAL